MTWILRASAFFATVYFPVVAAGHAADRAANYDASQFLSCAGMELAQNGEPKEDTPRSYPDTTPGDGPHGVKPSAPGDNDNGEDGAGSDQALPPDTAQPPGCIFQQGPLDLIV
ncbi:hypothetical protein [Hyphomicrobium facile]|uniref:Uncharacterized protein n=1 Tax=Hyphomicrobium facile TaxID=51670 RepID=A0A1I7MTK5_9HYPH|nr:hypothetical protein [Hyphomicrobium facile]SFV25733.1 hypothetical protein SAMN04488557_0072 [Hyphomicrobium facile]